MTVEDLLTDNVYTFELHEELVRSGDCDSWKEVAVRVDAAVSQATTPSDQRKTGGDNGEHTSKQNDDVTHAVDNGASAAQQSHLQLPGNCKSVTQ